MSFLFKANVASLAAFFCLSACAASTQAGSPPSGLETFRDCADCPEMVVIPDGQFVMGTAPTDPGHIADEGPQTEIAIGSFAVARHEVTRGEFKAFVEATGYQDETLCLSIDQAGSWHYDGVASWENPGFAQTDDHPVVCLSWKAANDYVNWLNAISPSGGYRLLTESEWEYAARAGSSSTYWWGEEQDDFCAITNGADRSARARYPGWERSGECDDGFVHTAPVGHYARPNPFGVEDMVGNVWEWVADCYAEDYSGKPRDGSAQISPDCEKRVFRGGAWGDYGAFYLRTAYRGAWTPEQSFTNVGFRVAKDMDD